MKFSPHQDTEPAPDIHPDPAVAQLQRAMVQAGERLRRLESMVETFARSFRRGQSTQGTR